MVQSVIIADKDSQEYSTKDTECRSSKTRIIENKILMIQSINSSKTRIIRNMILILQSVEVAGQGQSGVKN
jgi:hypothetical protein